MSKLPPGISAGVALGCSAAANDLKREFPEGEEHSLDEVMKRSMELTFDESVSFMCANDDERFKVGVGALMIYYKGDDEFQARVEHEMRLLAAFSASMSGMPVDFVALCGTGENEEEKPEALGLLAIFKDAKARLEKTMRL